ncbi:hypothetical protein [Paraferrimonas sp. SM1919]|uniref:hypothetical protein n=1 Tax=Paraferrimonas sp. SM1919 TaxID=2662263 RepID=UPI0013D2976E|nr:hypothetical protein [Paraferrimonas sp. SM1919]
MSQCFPNKQLAIRDPQQQHSLVPQWLAHYQQQPILFNAQQQTALAALLPLLLCGEESAQMIFDKQSQITDSAANQQLLSDLNLTVTEELLHEQALALVLSHVGKHEITNKARSAAKRFYITLAKTNTTAEHFIRIATLDTCVTQILLSLSNCNLGANHPLVDLCKKIAKDEAKHVYIAKHYAMTLGANFKQFESDKLLTVSKLMTLLRQFEPQFSQLAICLDNLEGKFINKCKLDI